MQSEDFDDKVKNAAEHHHPAYDEKAWDKMEELLDKHLPVEKDDRRRPLLFILLFLLLGSGAWLIATKPWQKNKSTTTAKQESSVPDQRPVSNETRSASSNNNKELPQTQSENKTPITTDNILPEKNSAPAEKIITKETFEKKEPGASLLVKKDNTPSLLPAKSKKDKVTSDVLKIKEMDASQNNVAPGKQPQNVVAEITENNKLLKIIPSVVSTDPQVNKDPGNDQDTKNDQPGVKDKTIADNKTINAKDDIKIDAVVSNKSETKKAAKNKKSSFFFLSLSAGPDISFAGGEKAGTTKLLTGAGLGYTFKNKLTIRSGFYSSRKIYSSGGYAYHPPASFYTYYPYLQKVDANCKVYEIPLLLSYSFGNSSKQNFFASTGLSSYLMKSEVYDYDYKTSYTSPVMKSKWTVDNKNKHFFSVLNLSAGYQRNINKNISLTIEPYYKLPLKGVGYGKVKLNSSGVLFTVGIKPFKTSAKKQP